MKVWTNNQLHGHWPVGTAAVVIADTPEQAAELLNAALALRGLEQPTQPEQFKEMRTDRKDVRVLADGNH